MGDTQHGHSGMGSERSAGSRGMVSGQWSVVSWSVVSGQWSVVSGQWSVVSDQVKIFEHEFGLLPLGSTES